MFNAQYLFQSGRALSPWMARQGDNVIITADLVAFSNSKINVFIRTKNSEDAGPGDLIMDPLNPTTAKKLTVDTVGRGFLEFSGEVKELVRYEFRAAGGLSREDYVLFRMLTPVWFDAVAVTA